MDFAARRSHLTVWLLVATIFVAFGCQEATIQSPDPPGPPALDKKMTAGVVTGTIGPGAKYEIHVPPGWNGDLILYAHGFVDANEPVDLPTKDGWPPVRDALIGLGYAVAHSSYSENGLAIKDGAQRTKQLESIFRSRFGKPNHTYLTAHSLGGLVTIKLLEKYHKRYDGALIMAGMIGSSQAEIDYIADVRVLFDFFYPGCLPGDAMNVPTDVDLNDVINAIVTCVMSDGGQGAGAIACFLPVPFSSPPELVESLVRAIGFNFRGFEDVFDRTHDHYPYDNMETVYNCPLMPPPMVDAINASVDRFATTPDAAAYLRHYYEPDGDLHTPVLTLHNALDPIVPVFHEDLYRERVMDAGQSDYLVQRTVNYYGHGMFAPDDATSVAIIIAAFEDLVNWVENGVKPAP